MRRYALALVGMAAGCALGPDYQRPALELPEAMRGAPPGASAQSIADQNWWQVYGDATLRDLLATALRNNFDLKTAVARIDEARAVLGQSSLALAPTIDANASVARTKYSEDVLLPGEPRFGNSTQVDLSASYEIDLWGRLRRARESARASLLSNQYAQRAVTVELVAEVASGYFSLLALDNQLQITRRTVQTRETFVSLTRAQHDRGYVTGLDVDTAVAQAAVARANVPELERQIGQLEDQICVLLGQNPHPIARPERGEELPPVPPLPPAGLPSQLLERRPDIRAAEESLRAANANVGVARAALFPTISLTGLAGSLSAPLGNLFKASSLEWSAAAGLVQPLLDPQRSVFQLELADARKREAIFAYEKAVQTAFQEVADALIAYAKYDQFEREQITQVEALRSAEAIALARYRVGYASYFDVINADRDLFVAELSLSQAHANGLITLVRLYQVLGGGWQSVPGS
jgi:multidrug efflux system outer membrane protein